MAEAAPKGTRAAGKRLWDDVLSGFVLEEHERTLLVQAVRTVDLLEALQGTIDSAGAVIDSPQGPRVHPAAVEARQQRIALARLLAALRVPWGEEGDQQAGARPQRRVGVRGAYGITGSVS